MRWAVAAYLDPLISLLNRLPEDKHDHIWQEAFVSSEAVTKEDLCL